MAPEPDAPPEQESYNPLALIGITLIALLGFAVFFLSFLVAPLAILMLFYVGFSASERSKRGSKGGGATSVSEQMTREAEARRAAMERPDAEQS